MSDKNLLLIHGAWASRNSFNYITEKLNTECNIQYFEYDCQTEPPEELLKRAIREYKEISKNGNETVVIGHSLGGILALYLSRFKGISNVITLASPINGVDSLNPFMHYFLFLTAPIFKCLLPKSELIVSLKEQDYRNVDVDILVACEGYNLAMPHKKSDGTISVESQMIWTPEGSRVHDIHSNHHEILLMPQTVEIIRKIINV